MRNALKQPVSIVLPSLLLSLALAGCAGRMAGPAVGAAGVPSSAAVAFSTGRDATPSATTTRTCAAAPQGVGQRSRGEDCTITTTPSIACATHQPGHAGSDLCVLVPPSPTGPPPGTTTPPTEPTADSTPGQSAPPSSGVGAEQILGPDGDGPLMLGRDPASSTLADFTSTPDADTSCATWELRSTDPVEAIVLSPTKGVAGIFARPGADIRTPEGMTFGWSVAQVHAAYPSFGPADANAQDGGPHIAVPGNAAAFYQVHFGDDGRIDTMALDATDQDCFDAGSGRRETDGNTAVPGSANDTPKSTPLATSPTTPTTPTSTPPSATTPPPGESGPPSARATGPDTAVLADITPFVGKWIDDQGEFATVSPDGSVSATFREDWQCTATHQTRCDTVANGKLITPGGRLTAKVTTFQTVAGAQLLEAYGTVETSTDHSLLKPGSKFWMTYGWGGAAVQPVLTTSSSGVFARCATSGPGCGVLDYSDGHQANPGGAGSGSSGGNTTTLGWTPFLGTWETGDGGSLLSVDIAGSVRLTYRTYVWCGGSAGTTPCDKKTGDLITPGGQVSARVTSVDGNSVTATIKTSNDPKHAVGSAFALALTRHPGELNGPAGLYQRVSPSSS